MAKKQERRRRLRQRLSERQNHRCAYCGERMQDDDPCAPNALTLDHLQTRQHGGRYAEKNMVAACLRCNNARDTENPQRFFRRRGWEAQETLAS